MVQKITRVKFYNIRYKKGALFMSSSPLKQVGPIVD